MIATSNKQQNWGGQGQIFHQQFAKSIKTEKFVDTPQIEDKKVVFAKQLPFLQIKCGKNAKVAAKDKDCQ